MKLFWFTWKKEKLSHNFLHRLLFTIYECRKIVISHKTITCSSVFWQIPNPLSLSTWIPHLNSTKAWHQLIKFLIFPHFRQCCVHLWHTTAFIRAALLYTVEVITVKCKLFVALFQKASSVCCYCTDLDNNAHIYNTHTHSFSVSRLPLAARLTKGQFKAKCSRRRLNKPLESPRARGPLGKPSAHTQMRTHSHTHPSDRLTEVIESPFASESFHHRPDRPHHAAASRTDVCIDQTNRQQVVTSMCVWERTRTCCQLMNAEERKCI